MPLHAFVAMPFGIKPDHQGNAIDFNRVYEELILPALQAGGFEPFRADEEQRGGDIRADMFQELLIADLVVADISINNPNVWYELGVRHALRQRDVVLISGGDAPKAFDVYPDRKLRYSLQDGAPDPETLAADRANLTAMAVETMNAWHGRKVSPVYQLLPHLQEPVWKALRVGNVREFWDRYDAWEQRIILARKHNHIGDILVLADEAPVSAFRAEARIAAGKALRQANHFRFALEQLELGLSVEPDNLTGLQEMGICLQRLALQNAPGHSTERTREHYRTALQQYPGNPELLALLGRVDKDAWINAWRRDSLTADEQRSEAAYEDALLRAAIKSYAEAFRSDPRHYFSGINALTLMHLLQHLTGEDRYGPEIADMTGAVTFAARNESDDSQRFWARVTLGELAVLAATPAAVTEAYKGALALNDQDWFALDSSRSQLALLAELGFRPEAVNAALKVFDRALEKAHKPDSQWEPRRVFLFSGHMVDTPDRSEPRFPADPDIQRAAVQRIAEALDAHGAGSEDLALTQGACGGDLLFTEACLQRGLKIHWLQPFPEPTFIERSVVRGGEEWRERYLQARQGLAAPIRTAPEELGEPPAGTNSSYPYQRCNLWLLYEALSQGIDKLHFICLWNGGGGDNPGGTEHMYQQVKERTGQVTWIDTRTL